jgi:hypothetical protein
VLGTFDGMLGRAMRERHQTSVAAVFTPSFAGPGSRVSVLRLD